MRGAMKAVREQRWDTGVVAVAVLTVLFVAQPLQAQAPITLSGRVVAAAADNTPTDDPIQNAVVTLDGFGSVLTDEDGRFTFSRVTPGERTLLVEALGYVVSERVIRISDNTVLAIALEVDPVQLDALDVEASTLDFHGRVRDPGIGANVANAQIRSSQGHDEQSSVHGRFDLDDVYEHVPLQISILAFGFMPFDTILVPDDEERIPFHLEADPFMARMMEVQDAALDERANAFFYRPAVNRQDMTRFLSNGNLQMVMERKFPFWILERVGCFFFDERLITSREERTFILENTLANELQRVEIREFPGFGRLFMARVYTRRYYQRLVGSGRKLDKPVMSENVCR